MSRTIVPARALDPQDRRALLFGALIVGLLLAYAWVGRPWLNRIGAERVQLAQQQELFAREKTLLESQPQLPRLQRLASQTLSTARTRLLSGDSVTATASLASYVDDIAIATGVHVSSLEGRAPASSAGLTTVTVELRGEARWSQALTFIRTVESTGSLISVKAIRLERGARAPQAAENLVTISATLSGIAAR